MISQEVNTCACGSGNRGGRKRQSGRVGETVTGAISLDNLLIVAACSRKLPGEVTVIEIEPGGEAWSGGFPEAVERAVSGVIREIRHLCGC